MFSGSSLTPTDVLAVFTKEVLTRQGRVSETFDDGKRVFSRSILPHIEDVRPGDQLRGGVALKATENEVWMFPYTFRLVCSNGAIVAQTIDSWSIQDLHILEPEFATQSIREGVEICSKLDVFEDNIRLMRNAAQIEADFTLNLLPFLSRFSARGDAGLITQIMNQFIQEGDRSQFGLANAVTAIARDTSDPELRWDLEELGGSIAIGRNSPAPVRGPGRARAMELASVS